MPNLILIGAGEHSLANHAPAMQHLALQRPGEVRLAALCDLDVKRAEQACAAFGFEQMFSSIDQMLAQIHIDAAVAVVPVPAILPVTRQLLTARVPLMIEKPLGQDLAEARQIADIVRASGVPVQVSLNRRYDPAIALGLSWAREQGPIRTVHGQMLRHNRTEPEFLWGTGLHLLDALCYIAGPLTMAQAHTAPPRAAKGPHRRTTPVGALQRIAEDPTSNRPHSSEPPHPQGPSPNPPCTRIGLLHNDDVACSFAILPACGRVDETLTITGDGYCVEVRVGTHLPWRVTAWRDRKVQWMREAPPEEPEYIRTGALRELEAFLEAVKTGTTPHPTIEDAMPATLLAAQLQNEHYGGSKVPGILE